MAMNKKTHRFLTAASTAGLCLASAAPAFAQRGYYYNQDWWGPHMMFGFGGGWFGGIFMMAFWVLLIVAAVVGIRWLIQITGKGAAFRGPGQADNAMNILRERYAKGEITKEQFEAMKNDLLK
jgi:putative membrane protein